MIIVKLMGGLGNQMFQYAMGRRLSLDRQVPLKLDLSWYEVQAPRSYQLNNFHINAEVVTSSELESLAHLTKLDPYSRFFRQSQRFLPASRRRIMRETSRGFDPRCLRASDQVFLMGYWQSEEYFKSVERLIREEFELKEKLHPENTHLEAQIRSCDGVAVSLHVRRGDYLSPQFAGVYHICDLEYYQRAMEHLAWQDANPKFFVFSDDVPWARENLSSQRNVTIVDNNYLGRDWETLYLMRVCSHHIIANSSFSWWGAWLGDNPGKIVIAPQQWFAKTAQEPRCLIPRDWVRI